MTKFGLALPKLPDAFFLTIHLRIHPDRWIWCVLFVAVAGIDQLLGGFERRPSVALDFHQLIPLESARIRSKWVLGSQPTTFNWWFWAWAIDHLESANFSCSHWSTRHTSMSTWTIGDRQMDSRRCFKENLLACARWLYHAIPAFWILLVSLVSLVSLIRFLFVFDIFGHFEPQIIPLRWN